MKKIFISLLFLSITNLFSQEYYLAAPEGYGAATTGGGDAEPIVVSTFADLKTQLVLTGSKVILVSGEITVPFGQPISAVISNKTLIGLPGAKLINENQSNPGAGIMYLKPGSNNVIIRNLIFVGPGAYDIDGQDNLTADGCTNLWVDHCEFQDGQDGNFDIKGLSDNVTVSWCKFTYLKPPVSGGSGGSSDHRFSNLVGSSASNAPADGHYNVTFQGCYWAAGCKDRMPRGRNLDIHLLNCYYNTGISNSKAIGLGGGTNNSTCYVESCNFANVGTIFSIASSDGGTVAINYSNCLNMGGASDLGTVTPPSYTATVIPVEELEGYMTDATCGAGATLQVETNGTVNPSPCATAIDEQVTDKDFVLYPVTADDTLNILAGSKFSGKGRVMIFSVTGQKVLDAEKMFNPSETVSLNVSGLECGIYTCRIEIEDRSLYRKFIKK